MKKVKSLMAVATALVLLSSCQNADNNPVSDSVPLSIKTTFGTTTKSVISSFPNASALGLFVTSGALGNNYEGTSSYQNVKSTYSGSAWSQATPVYLTNNNAAIYAYYPYSAVVTNGTIIPVEATSQTDYMYGSSNDVNNSSAIATLSMKHALALVEFKMNKTNYPGVGLVTKIEIANASGKTILFSEGTLNCSTGTISNTSGKNISASISNGSGLLTLPATASSDESTYPKVMVLPTAATVAAGDLVINFTIDGKVYTYQVPASTTWLGGSKNIYTVTLSGTAVSVNGSVAITDWTSGVNGTAGLN
jgi:hypothetical protein